MIPASIRRPREDIMALKLNAPSQVLFLVSLVIAVVALVGQLTPIPLASANGFWLAIIAYVVLAVGTVAKGL
jgi:hypothetical protein